MFEVGRVCVKIAGRDAGRKAVIIDTVDKNYVVIDGQTRRRKCNIDHLEPLEQKIDVSKGASHEQVVEAFGKIGVEIVTTKPKKAADKPVTRRSVRQKKKKLRAVPVKKPVVKPSADKPDIAAKTGETPVEVVTTKPEAVVAKPVSVETKSETAAEPVKKTPRKHVVKAKE